MADLGSSNSNWHAMKVLFDYSNIESLYQTKPTEYRYMVQFLFPIVRDWIEKNLKVTGTQMTKAMFNPCRKASVPSNLFQQDIPADLIIMVTAADEPDASYVAWASACQVSGFSGRPDVGQVHINLKHLNTNFAQFFDTFGTIIHEVTHVLGFSSGMYKRFINPVTGSRLGESNVVQDQSVSGKNWKMLVTPKVKAFVNQHFGCGAGSMAGGPLEDEGSAGSAGSHWEKLFFSSEFMSAATVSNPVISELTIALLEDSGWYQFNRGAVFDGKTIDYEPFFWLKDKGCGVYAESCPQSSSACPTADVNKYGCSYDSTFRGVCRTVGFANSCNYYVPWQPWPTYDCREINHHNDDWKRQGERFGEERGSGSRCWNGNLTNTRVGYRKSANFCFKSSCTTSGQLSLVFHGKSYPCSGNNADIVVREASIRGVLKCPSDTVRFCQRMNQSCPNDCMGKGRCMANKQCLCYDGFTGRDCGKQVTQTFKTMWGTNQEYETLRTGSCAGGGTWLGGTGACMCKIGWRGVGCCEQDTLGSYFNGPNSLKGPVYSRPSSCSAAQSNSSNNNNALPSGPNSNNSGATKGNKPKPGKNHKPATAALSVVALGSLLVGLLAIN